MEQPNSTTQQAPAATNDIPYSVESINEIVWPVSPAGDWSPASDRSLHYGGFFKTKDAGYWYVFFNNAAGAQDEQINRRVGIRKGTQGNWEIIDSWYGTGPNYTIESSIAWLHSWYPDVFAFDGEPTWVNEARWQLADEKSLGRCLDLYIAYDSTIKVEMPVTDDCPGCPPDDAQDILDAKVAESYNNDDLTGVNRIFMLESEIRRQKEIENELGDRLQIETFANSIRSRATKYYNSHYDNDLYNRAREHDDNQAAIEYNNWIIDQALALSGYPTYTIDIREIMEASPAVRAFLARFCEEG